MRSKQCVFTHDYVLIMREKMRVGVNGSDRSMARIDILCYPVARCALNSDGEQATHQSTKYPISVR